MLDKVSEASFNQLWEQKYDISGKLKEDAEPIAQGSFASIFPMQALIGEAAEEKREKEVQYIVRVANSPAGPAQQFTYEKELQALIAYLKLSPSHPCDEPSKNELVWINTDEQPRGLCNIFAYYVIEKPSQRTIFTIMPLGKPLMDVIEEELIAASGGGESTPRDLSQVVGGISQLALALQMMHKKGIYWRDCKVDNVILMHGKAQIIDINSGVCTVGYASHEQLAKLPIESFTDSQAVTDALEQVLQSQPDHQTWETQDVFALSIVIMEWLTYGMFTYPYNREEAAPSYVHLLLYELKVYNLLLSELSDLYDVSVLKGRLDRKIKHWAARIGEGIDPTSQIVRDLTLWPLAVTEFRRDRRLFDMWAALAFWDHVDHQFGFIGHWLDWYFDFNTHAQEPPSVEPPTPPPAPPPQNSEVHAQMQDWTQRAGTRSSDVLLPPTHLEAPSAHMLAKITSHNAAENRSGGLILTSDTYHLLATENMRSGQVHVIKARLHERCETLKQMEEDHTARVVKRLASLTQRMDSLNSSLASFFDHSASPAPTQPPSSPPRPLPSVKVCYGTPRAALALLASREAAAKLPHSDAASAGGGARLLEVRLRVCTGESEAARRAEVLRLLGKSASTPKK